MAWSAWWVEQILLHQYACGVLGSGRVLTPAPLPWQSPLRRPSRGQQDGTPAIGTPSQPPQPISQALLVAVAGCSGSGKTKLAHELAETLNLI